MKALKYLVWAIPVLLIAATSAFAGEADLAIPNLWEHGSFHIFGQEIRAGLFLLVGSLVIIGTIGISLLVYIAVAMLLKSKELSEVAKARGPGSDIPDGEVD